MTNKKNALIGLIAISTLIGCGSTETETDTNDNNASPVVQEETVEAIPIIEDVNVESFKEKLSTASNALILDVRTPEEYAAGSIEGAVNMDFFNATFESNLDSLDKSEPVFVYCKSGGRSGKATKMLEEKGFIEVYNLIGGYTAWSN
ncbi:rhodanese-like domain-containing protein [Crocinitomix sp.]|nr:rhodanese-like domain-containing protein [Crocinitomix sp.]